MDLDDFLSLKKKLDEKKHELARLQGKKESLLQRLSSEFECNSIQEARKRMKREQKELVDLEKEYRDKVEKFEDCYGDLLK